MSNGWPALDVDRDAPTFAILHLVSQMLGKLRVAHAPWANHGWHVTLLPVAEGLVMPPIAARGKRFELVLDLAPMRWCFGAVPACGMQSRWKAEALPSFIEG